MPTAFLFVGLFLVTLTGWIGWNAWRSVRGSDVKLVDTVGIELGQVAPDFSVPTLEEDTFTLSEQRGKPTILLFMAYWCGTCFAEAEALAQLKQEYGEGISIVALDVDPTSTPEALNQFKRASGDGAYTWAFDLDQQVTTTYQVRSLDTTYILDTNGVIVYRDEYITPYKILKEALTQAGF